MKGETYASGKGSCMSPEKTTEKLYHRKKGKTMFNFKITLNDLAFDTETGKSKNAVVEGTACGTIEDHLKTLIKVTEPDGFEASWVKIGSVLVRYSHIISIETEAVKG